MHEHTECEHKELKYCKVCDIVYCKCDKEWKVENSIVTWTHADTGTGTWPPIGTPLYPFISINYLSYTEPKRSKTTLRI